MIKIGFTPKVVFFDIDDTLSRKGKLATNSIVMLEKLAKTNIKIVIATGRPVPILPKDILDFYKKGVFDAIISTNGQYSFNFKGIISHYPLSKEQKSLIVDICKPKACVYKFDSNKEMAFSESIPQLKKLEDLAKEHRGNYVINPDFHEDNIVYQSSVFFKEDDYKMNEVNFDAHDLKIVHWHSLGADILPKNASKARAIVDVCTHLELSPDEAIAFGDGNNDVEMLSLVGFGVAMGDGQEKLKACANYVTGSIEDDGIADVFKKLLIF